MRAFYFRLLLTPVALLPSAAHAQWPGAIEGRAVDALTRGAVEAASVRIEAISRHALTSAGGRFHLRSLEPGIHELTIERAGYAPARLKVEVANGRTSPLVVEMVPVVDLAPIDAHVDALAAGGVRIAPGPLDAGRAGTVGDLLVGLAGVTVLRRGPGAAETISIRGSSADAVLVLVDGVPLNDPVTGEADLSSIPAGSVRDVTVLPGARSARYGARAEAGVVLVRTGSSAKGPTVEGSAGSLGQVGGRLSWAGGGSARSWDALASAETIDGRFPYRQDASLGGGGGLRENADLSRWSAQLGVEADVPGGRGVLRVRGGRLERGIPGRSFAPSPSARQDERSVHLAATWRGAWDPVAADAELFGSLRATTFRDPSPSVGVPYDQDARVGQVGARGHLLSSRPRGPLDELGFGWDATHQRVRADALAAGAPGARTDLGAFVTAGRRFQALSGEAVIRAAGRLHRDGTDGGLVPSHEVEASWTHAPLVLRLSHRSSFSPPSLADQFFREGVGVEPNPDLRAEHVPSELEAGIELAMDRGPWTVGATLSAYRGDVRDMIVWSPDYRFVWSPRNVDVLRRGIDARLEAATTTGLGRLEATGSYALTRVTYDREGGRTLQLRYRPRHSGEMTLALKAGGSSASLAARYMGSRLPVPSEVNRLPGFWSFRMAATTAFRLSGWWVRPFLAMDRLLDTRESMIFAFPEPGRTFRAGLSLSRPQPRTTIR